MGKIDDLNRGDFDQLLRRARALEYATPLNGSSIGSGGMRFYGTGKLLVENEGLEVTGTATIAGTLNADGTVNLTGVVGITGPLTVTGDTALNGTTTVGGDTTITGDLDVDGTLDINGATTLNSDLTVASGKKITLGGLTLQNTGASGGQVNFPGGSITASSALGMLINHNTVEIAGTVVKLSSLPTTTQPANLYVDGTGHVFRSIA
ncbi:hypothetical protein ACQCSX_08780 [Pseudarthrobacter sp. P1]|uniref:hypothetical protein n=1 Tax=Pseudarthrobacter sp. P1 TaxID=3418418 RepID=UPI003CF3AB3B